MFKGIIEEFKNDLDSETFRRRRDTENKIRHNAGLIYLNGVLELNQLQNPYNEAVKVAPVTAMTTMALREVCPKNVRSLTIIPGITASRETGVYDWQRENYQNYCDISSSETLDKK